MKYKLHLVLISIFLFLTLIAIGLSIWIGTTLGYFLFGMAFGVTVHFLILSYAEKQERMNKDG